MTSTIAPAEEATGLRERKKRETSRAIEVAAVELAAELGLGEVTVESISQRADVTSRTFFNYYASKEDAVLGNSRAFPRPSLHDLKLRRGASVRTTVLEAVRDQLSGFDFGTPAYQHKKRAVLLASPQLLAKDFQSLGDIETDIAQQTRRLLDEEGLVPPAERDAHAWAIVFFIWAVVRLALQTWSQSTDTRRALADHVDSASRILSEVGRARS
ncbi:MAG: TetR family transcriptional regulator [Herbiconiux sp.]|uniref:TetR/AcrR family transcriptional regulator n=1 Tax=Herbiconiux sp. TaxID=1871186 RepID=UPI00122AF9F9|nr:helix-turn-helix domain-containing protein [Herbiconiux sp.]TAJ46822.1 MAG: TetR family transcriptional regulator [Herbiconiux sp.]